MSRQRDRREAKALEYIRRKGFASALEIGGAAVKGEARDRRMPQRAREAIGLSIAVKLAHHGVVQATKDNDFVLR